MRYLLFFLGIKCDGASRSALKQRFTESVEYIGRDSGLLIANGGLFLYLLQTLVDGLKILIWLIIYYLLVADSSLYRPHGLRDRRQSSPVHG